MKHCLYNIFLTLGIVLLLASCSDDSIPDDIGGEDNGKEVGDRFSLAIRIPLQGNLTKATGTNIGVGGEYLIDGVRIVFYGDDNLVAYSLDLDIKSEVTPTLNITGKDVSSWTTDGKSIFIQTTTPLVSPGNYDMLIIVNPKNAIKIITGVGQPKNKLDIPLKPEDMYSTRTINGGTENEYKEGVYFVMLNSQGLIPITRDNFFSTKDLAELNPVPASVERAVAKIECTYTGTSTKSTPVAPYGRFVMLLDYNNQQKAPWYMDYDIPEDCIDCPVEGCTGKFNLQTKKCSLNPHIHTYDALGLVSDRVRYMVATDLTWQVDIVNQKSYWLRQLTHKLGGSMETAGDTDRINFYAEDPNFENFSGESNLNDQFTYITTAEYNSTAKKLYPPAYKYSGYWSWTKADTEPVYIPENTMVQNDQKRDVVTRAIFKATLRREEFLEKESNPNPVLRKPIGDFFVFTGGNTNIENYKYNNYNKDNSTFYILRPEDVAIYASEASTENIHIYLRDGILEAIAQFKADNPSFNWTDISANENPAISKDLIFYKNGEIYYEIPIEHFSVSEAGFGQYGRFGVVRNNWYKLNVIDIISIGKPTIPEPVSEFIEDPNIRRKVAGNYSTGDSDLHIRSQSIIF